MAAYFISRFDSLDASYTSREFHVGGVKEYPSVAKIMQIECVQADGDELQHIFECCPGLHIAFDGHNPRPVQRWFGDTAKFIANAIWR